MCMQYLNVVVSITFPFIFTLAARWFVPPPPIIHTASNKNLGIGKAGYDAMYMYSVGHIICMSMCLKKCDILDKTLDSN